jgi:acyl dehydratase
MGQRVNTFADATCDWQWIHTEPERAKKESPFGTHAHPQPCLHALTCPHTHAQAVRWLTAS